MLVLRNISIAYIRSLFRYVCGLNVAFPLTFSLYIRYKPTSRIATQLTIYNITNVTAQRCVVLRHPFKGSVMRTSSKRLALLTVTLLRTDFAALLLSACQLDFPRFSRQLIMSEITKRKLNERHQIYRRV